jgi:hypothetical protein
LILQDVCSLLDTKANTDDINKVIVDVCKELGQKAQAADLRHALKEQALINAGLCADMSFGRWLWKSGKTKAGRAVPWNVQVINSDPDNYVWDKDKVWYKPLKYSNVHIVYAEQSIALGANTTND